MPFCLRPSLVVAIAPARQASPAVPAVIAPASPQWERAGVRDLGNTLMTAVFPTRLAGLARLQVSYELIRRLADELSFCLSESV